jgi:beta-glucosidase
MAVEGSIGFPEGFLWGAATSAHQVEGGNLWNDWWRFEHRSPDVPKSHQSGEACRHWELFDRDFGLAAADGHNAHRLSIEWSRIEPEPGRISAEAVAHYHEVFASLRRHRLTPIVTLHHFTLPAWVADAGGWESRRTLDHFEGFVRFCAREYGGEVDWWCTVNEPEVLAFRGWSEGLWPPLVRDDSRALAAMALLLEAHGRAYRVIHAEDKRDADGDGRPARVGFAKHMPQLEPLRPWNVVDGIRAWFEDRVFNQAVLAAPRTGVIRLSIPGAHAVQRRVAELENSLDWLGLNYYTRWMVDATSPSKPHVARPGSPTTDLDWEIYPAGLERATRRAAGLGVPVIVTEHGFADATDRFRPRALVDSLARLSSAIQGGAQVLGYLHWSLMDNFEWADGYSARFGLYRVDFERDPGGRGRTRSAEVFATIARANAIPAELRQEVRVGSEPAR